MEPIIFDTSDGQQLRINMISPWFKRHYAELGLDSPAKIVKLSLDGGFTCPNRDGSKGTGGCLFCSESGSGDMASAAADIRQALASQIQLLSDKWPSDKYHVKYLAYFQSHTNTYAPVDELRAKFEAALEAPDVVGIAIATRPDCIPEDVLDLLSELNEKTFLWVELGLQTIHDSTAKDMNLCHGRADYDDAVRRLTARGIRVVTHLILGLPGETREMMLESVRYACRDIGVNSDTGGDTGADNGAGSGTDNVAVTGSGSSSGNTRRIFGLKLHMLNVVRGSGMANSMPDYVPFDSMEEYIDLLISALEIVPPEITLHRISGDAPRATLIAPAWSYKKRTILNNIHKEMRQRDTWQGRLAGTSGVPVKNVSKEPSL